MMIMMIIIEVFKVAVEVSLLKIKDMWTVEVEIRNERRIIEKMVLENVEGIEMMTKLNLNFCEIK